MNRSLSLDKVSVLGIELSVWPERFSLLELVKLVKDSGNGLAVHFINAYNLFLFDKDANYRFIIRKADVAFCDGKPLYWAAKLLGIREITQIRGPSYFRESLEGKNNKGIRHFFIGGNAETKTSIVANLGNLMVNVVGFETPPFRDLTSQEYQERDKLIEKARPDVIWVGLGTPKQDTEVRRLSENHSAVVIAVGAAFDFYAGTKREAPRFIQKLGVEWFFRLLAEPKRLWKRYFFGNIYFISKLFNNLISYPKKKI